MSLYIPEIISRNREVILRIVYLISQKRKMALYNAEIISRKRELILCIA